MKLLGLSAVAFFLAGIVALPASAQTLASTPSDAATSAQLQALTRKIDEQNSKIDTLSQQILKLEQQITTMRPGVMIGEATPAPPVAVVASAAPESSGRPVAAGNIHTVARGETLTSIAKMHNVTVSDLQKANHIENDRKLQIGQTLLIPGPSTPAASTSPSD